MRFFKERFKEVSRELQEAGIDYERAPAVDGSQLTPEAWGPRWGNVPLMPVRD